MIETSRPLDRDEIEAAIKNFDRQIRGLREGIISRGSRANYDPNSRAAQEEAKALKVYLEQRELLSNYLRRLDQGDTPPPSGIDIPS
jgi:hypothetical protein